jgi:gamma-glutamylcyclotransferase (GGCT)/AIG2-like uncharacterized protein YtfP
VRYLDADCPADPYPGTAPPCSYVHVDAVALRLDPDPRAAGGWRVGDRDLDGWLVDRGAPPAAGRVPLLAYGSNRCPSKITWLRMELGLAGPVVVLRARTEHVAAVWAAGFRARDGQRVAVLAAAPGTAEVHAVWLATPDQVEVLDRCEGRGERFRLARLWTGRVTTEDGLRVDGAWCYLGLADTRRPLLVDGAPIRCVDVAQPVARDLRGEPARGDDLEAPTVDGAPHPDEWPAALFTYGLLRPGQPSWPLVEPHASGPARAATVDGTVYDTGRGYPALRPGTGSCAPGWLVPLRDPAALLPALDAYEGPEYRRVRLVTGDGTVCWAYAWCASTRGMAECAAGWHC